MKNMCERDCDKCSLLMCCQGCSLCEMPFCKQDCSRCFTLCPQRGTSFNYLRNVDGGQIDILPQKNKIDLPPLIPVLPDHLTEELDIAPVVGIHGGNFFSSNGERVAPVYMRKGLKDTLNLKSEVEGVLQFYVKDRTLEGLWDQRQKIYDQLANFSWRAVISPNFSVYEDTPRIDHLYNIKRSSIVYNELISKGFPAIPDISWYNKIDLDQWINEINKKSIKQIAFSFQTVGTATKASNSYINYLTGFKYLMDNIPAATDIVIAGMVSEKRVELLKSSCKNKLAILNQSAYIHSRRGILSETGKAGGGFTKNEIFKQNLMFYDRVYRR